MAQSTTRSFPPMRKARSTWQWSAKLFAPTNATNWGRGVQIETNLAVCRLGCHAAFQSQPKLIFQKFQRPCRIGKRHRSLDEPLTPCFDNHVEWRVAWQGKAVSGPSRPTVWESEVTIVLGKPGTCNKSVACCDVLGPPSSGKPVLCWWRCPGKIRSWYLRSHITRRCRLHLLTVWDGMNDLSHAPKGIGHGENKPCNFSNNTGIDIAHKHAKIWKPNDCQHPGDDVQRSVPWWHNSADLDCFREPEGLTRPVGALPHLLPWKMQAEETKQGQMRTSFLYVKNHWSVGGGLLNSSHTWPKQMPYCSMQKLKPHSGLCCFGTTPHELHASPVNTAPLVSKESNH